MANRRRGEIAATFGGERYTLCLTLGALAELEDAFGVDDLSALAARFGTGRLSGADLVRLVGAGLRGGGHALSDDDLRAWPAAELPALAGAAAALLAATFGALAPDPRSPQPA